jgi:hypothetical protein
MLMGFFGLNSLGLNMFVYFFHDIPDMRKVKNGPTSHEFHHLFIEILVK